MAPTKLTTAQKNMYAEYAKGRANSDAQARARGFDPLLATADGVRIQTELYRYAREKYENHGISIVSELPKDAQGNAILTPNAKITLWGLGPAARYYLDHGGTHDQVEAARYYDDLSYDYDILVYPPNSNMTKITKIVEPNNGNPLNALDRLAMLTSFVVTGSGYSAFQEIDPDRFTGGGAYNRNTASAEFFRAGADGMSAADVLGGFILLPTVVPRAVTEQDVKTHPELKKYLGTDTLVVLPKSNVELADNIQHEFGHAGKLALQRLSYMIAGAERSHPTLTQQVKNAAAIAQSSSYNLLYGSVSEDVLKKQKIEIVGDDGKIKRVDYAALTATRTGDLSVNYLDQIDEVTEYLGTDTGGGTFVSLLQANDPSLSANEAKEVALVVAKNSALHSFYSDSLGFAELITPQLIKDLQSDPGSVEILNDMLSTEAQ